MRKNILFFILALVLSLVTAPYLGAWYDKFSFQDSGWMGDRDGAIFFAGMLVSYVVLVPFILELLGQGNRRKLITWLLVPILLFWISADSNYIYIPIILSLIGFSLAWLLRKVFVRHHNLPMVINK